MSLQDDNPVNGCACILILLAIVIGCFIFMTSQGYHQQWSPVNGKFIWVDKDGKP